MNESRRVYSVDTSALIQLQPMRRRNFRRLWEHLDAIAGERRVLVSEEVQRELGDDTDEDPVAWLRNNPQIVVPTERSWETARVVANSYPSLVDLAKPHGTADPHVIAIALDERQTADGQLWQTEIIALAQERRKRPQRSAIPDVCDDYELLCVNLQGLFDTEGWQDL